MNCNDCSELLDDYVTGSLDLSQQNDVESHLQTGCEVCNKELHHIQAAFASLAAGIKPIAPPADLKAKLLAQIREREELKRLSATAGPRPDTVDYSTGSHREPTLAQVRPRGFDRRNATKLFSALAAGVVGLAAGYTAIRIWPVETPQDAPQQSELASNDSLTSADNPNSIRFISANPTENSTTTARETANDYVAFDQFARQLHVYIDVGDRLVPNSQLYVVLELANETFRDIGTITVAAKGSAMDVFDMPVDDASVKRVIVSRIPSTQFTAAAKDYAFVFDVQ